MKTWNCAHPDECQSRPECPEKCHWSRCVTPVTEEQVMELLNRFHRNSCYPDAMDFELQEAARAVMALVRGER